MLFKTTFSQALIFFSGLWNWSNPNVASLYFSSLNIYWQFRGSNTVKGSRGFSWLVYCVMVVIHKMRLKRSREGHPGLFPLRREEVMKTYIRWSVGGMNWFSSQTLALFATSGTRSLCVSMCCLDLESFADNVKITPQNAHQVRKRRCVCVLCSTHLCSSSLIAVGILMNIHFWHLNLSHDEWTVWKYREGILVRRDHWWSNIRALLPFEA